MKSGTFLLGVGVGAAIAYLCDAQLGRRRRGLLRDAIAGATHRAERGLAAAGKDAWHRLQGTCAEALHRGEHKDDRAVRERVKAKIGHSFIHVSAIRIDVAGGQTTLSGPIQDDEASLLIAIVRSVPGVRGVVDRLDRQPAAVMSTDDPQVKSLIHVRPKMARQRWSPARRLGVGTAGAALVAYSLTQEFPIACILGTLGLGLMARAAADSSLQQTLQRLIEHGATEQEKGRSARPREGVDVSPAF